jgi:hypothetical protein
MLQLLLFAKATGSKVTWHDPTDDQKKTRFLTAGDWRVWIRFLMSFIINGVGLHFLVHALPIQVAAQSSLTGVVFRAVGMLYLVDLDDTPGYTLTFTDHDDDEAVVKQQETTDGEDSENNETTEDEVEKIIQDAHARIDAIRAAGTPKCKLMKLSGGMALAAAGGVAGAKAAEKQKNERNEDKNEGETTGDGVENQA